MEGLAKFIGVIVLVGLFIVIVGALYAFPIKWLWNWLMPALFAFPKIDVFQAWGLLVLSGILFRSSSSSEKNS